MIFDCCHSGTMADLPFRYTGGDVCTIESNKKFSGDIITISGCRDDQTSADAWIREERNSYGALTYSIIDTIKRYNVREMNWIDFFREGKR